MATKKAIQKKSALKTKVRIRKSARAFARAVKGR
jgi:hypothetical protein